MRKARTGGAILALLLCLVIAATPAAAATMGVVATYTKNGTVNLRSGASTYYPVIGIGSNGDLLRILSTRGSWKRVTLVKSGVTGYMYGRYVTKMVDIEDMSEWGTLAHIKTTYESSTVALRRGPGTSYGIKESLYSGQTLAILDKIGRWYFVQVIPSQRTGYVYKTYIANGIPGVTTTSVNLRRRASASSEIVRTAPYGASITVLHVGKYWAKVRYDGRTGYMYNKYIRLF